MVSLLSAAQSQGGHRRVRSLGDRAVRFGTGSSDSHPAVNRLDKVNMNNYRRVLQAVRPDRLRGRPATFPGCVADREDSTGRFHTALTPRGARTEPPGCSRSPRPHGKPGEDHGFPPVCVGLRSASARRREGTSPVRCGSSCRAGPWPTTTKKHNTTVSTVCVVALHLDVDRRRQGAKIIEPPTPPTPFTLPQHPVSPRPFEAKGLGRRIQTCGRPDGDYV
jgi:hypothetical protein